MLSKRSSSILHVLLNIGLVTLIYFMVVYWNLTLLAIALILLSKWRIVGVRVRFWWANTRANLPDIIVGISTVAWLSVAPSTTLKILIIMSYAAWLLVVKPNTTRSGMVLQAGWSTFVGLNTTIILGFESYDILALLLVWVIVWSNARHFLSIFDDEHSPLLAVVWATMATQIAWLCLQWVVIFRWPSGFLISQYVLLIMALSYGLGGWYRTIHDNDEKPSLKTLLVKYGLFCVLAVTIILGLSPWHTVL